MTNPAPTPFCARCRQAIAGPSRKDRFGNAYCEACAQALIAATERVKQRAAGLASIQARATAAASVSTGPAQAAPPIPLSDRPPTSSGPAVKLQERGPLAPGSDSGHSGVFAPPGEAAAGPEGILALEPEREVAKPRMRMCEGCSKSINADVFVCAYCGYDGRLGPPAKLKKPLHTCKKCGYDLAGLPEPICPECGTKNARRTSRSHLYEEESKEVTKWAYLRPAIMLGVGLVGLIILSLIRHGGDPKYLTYTFIEFFAGVPAVLGVYVACCALWIGFDMRLDLIALRVAGIFAVVSLVSDLVGLFPVSIVAWSVTWCTYIWMLAQELDLELQDALIIAVVSAGATWVSFVLIVAPIGRAMGLPV